MLLTFLGGNLNNLPPGKTLDISAPASKQTGSVDLIPNLILTTLAATLLGNPLLTNTPSPSRLGSVDSHPNLLVTTLVPGPPVGQRVFDSAPSVKYQPQVDVYPNQLALGFNPQPQVRWLTDSAPQVKAAVQVDIPSNLLPFTTVVTQNPLTTLDTSQWQGKYQVQADVYQNILVRGFNPQPQVRQQSDSAPWVKSAVQVDIPPNRLTLPVAPPFKPVDTSQWQGKFQVFAENRSVPLTLGINPQPRVNQWDLSAPPPKYQTQIEVYPNLSENTLVPTAHPIPLPLGLIVDVSQWQGKLQVQNDAYPNTLILGYPTPPPPPGFIPTPDFTGKHWYIASRDIMLAGLNQTGAPVKVNTRILPPGYVLYQYPLAGTFIAPGTNIQLTVVTEYLDGATIGIYPWFDPTRLT